jgi:ABC-type nitrate/sulfonate/bicarbonate transport system permease component
MLLALLLKLRVAVSTLLVASLWQGVWALEIVPEKYFPSIGRVAVAGWSMLASGELLTGDAATFTRALIGLIGAALLGVLLAVLSDLSPYFRKGFRPISDVAQPIPPAALVPMAVFALGLGWKLYAFIIVLVTVWPTYLNGLAALQSVSEVQLRTGQMLGLGRLEQLWHIKLPAALPEIFAGVRYAATLSLIAVIVSEMLAGRDGVGFMIFKKAFALRTPEVFALMFVIALNGVVLNALVDIMRWLMTGWHLRMMERAP